MDAEDFTDFVAALGEEYCEAISPRCAVEVVPQDCYEVFGRVFGFDALSPKRLHEAQSSAGAIERLRDLARAYHETDQISVDDIKRVVLRVLRRWPPSTS